MSQLLELPSISSHIVDENMEKRMEHDMDTGIMWGMIRMNISHN